MPSEESMKKAAEICAPSYSGGTRMDDAQHILDVATALDERTEECAKIADEYDTGGFGEWRNMAAAQTASREIAEAIRSLIRDTHY